MIDFTGLEKLKAPESVQNAPEQPQAPKAYNNPTRGQNAAQGREQGTDAEKNISRAIQRHREERERLERLRDRADKG